jgi:hypothetical protein
MNPAEYSAVVVFEKGQWIAICPQLSIASLGTTSENAIKNLQISSKERIKESELWGFSPINRFPTKVLRDKCQINEVLFCSLF